MQCRVSVSARLATCEGRGRDLNTKCAELSRERPAAGIASSMIGRSLRAREPLDKSRTNQMSMRTPLTSTGLMAVGLLLTAASGHARRAATTGGSSGVDDHAATGGLPGRPGWRTFASIDSSIACGSPTASPAAPAGALYVFLSDNVLVRSANGKPPSLGTWAEDVYGPGHHREGHDVQGGRARTDSGTPPPPHQRQDARRNRRSPRPSAHRRPHQPSRALPMPARRLADRRRQSCRSGWPSGAVPIACASPSRTTRPTSRGLMARRWRCRKRNRPRPATLARMYSDGQLRVVEDTSESFTRVLFARPGFRPRACTPAR